MSDTLTLSAEARDRAGKGASRALRREGRTPAVIYGGKQEPVLVHLSEKELTRALGTGHFFNSVVELTVGETVVRTLPKDVAFHPVSDRPEHADFFRLADDAAVHVRVPVRFVNETASPGLKKGGVLNVVHHELDLVCLGNAIPDDVVIDVTGLDVGASIHLNQIQLPAGVRSGSHERDLTIATIVAPSGLRSAEGDTTKA